ncbi:MAG TPA: SOS response-associated peptidase [Armatimonadota bacterium]|jgi:putative SOS response-associated peptidase YedK
MCGRYTLHQVILVQRRFEVLREIELMPSYNVAPGQIMPVIVRNSTNAIELMKWGLVPAWVKDPGMGSSMINARAETIADKPAFRDAFRRRRCLVPSNGFYEWKREGRRRIPMFIRPKDQELFAFAGLYERWRDEHGVDHMTYSIITTQPNGVVRAIHDRMPVILERADEAEWLDGGITDVGRLQRLLVPYPSEQTEAYQVSDCVNSPMNNTPALLEPVTQLAITFPGE